MKGHHQLAILALVIAALALALGRSSGSSADGDPPVYIADPIDCICGLADVRHLTHPARVEFPAAMEATPQMKELRAKGIDPDSARGVILRTGAEALVQRVCNQVRLDYRHCSVWKEIKRRDGRPIPDRTDAVVEVLSRIRIEEPAAVVGSLGPNETPPENAIRR